MKIVIQGPQACGKTRTAKNIASSYRPDAVLYVYRLSKLEINSHLHNCVKLELKPLLIFDDLTAKDFAKAWDFFAELESKNIADAIFITQGEINVKV